MDRFRIELDALAERLDAAAATIEQVVGEADRALHQTVWISARADRFRGEGARRRAEVDQVSSRLRTEARALRFLGEQMTTVVAAPITSERER